jgi:Arc/MetJ-type ribon-helix-helix transcriptional regulator
MKPISVHVPEGPYQELKSLAQRQGRPVAELIRQAMTEYLDRDRRAGRSLLEVRAHRSGRLRKRWTRAQIADEMIGR